MSRAERRAERRRSHGSSRGRAPADPGAGRRQQRVAIVLLAVLALVGFFIVAVPFVTPSGT